jgi:hypothetical protein
VLRNRLTATPRRQIFTCAPAVPLLHTVHALLSPRSPPAQLLAVFLRQHTPDHRHAADPPPPTAVGRLAVRTLARASAGLALVHIRHPTRTEQTGRRRETGTRCCPGWRRSSSRPASRASSSMSCSSAAPRPPPCSARRTASASAVFAFTAPHGARSPYTVRTN